MAYKCEKCSREFETIEALETHTKVKHHEFFKEQKKDDKGNKTIKLVVVLFIVLIAILTVFMFRNKDEDCLTIPVNEMNIGEHKNLALHIHPELKILVNGEEKFIPTNIGISENFMRPIHTHTQDGVLHIESPCTRNFKVGEVFEIWGKVFNSTCIFEYCTDEGTLKMYVNGQESFEFENYLMHDEDKIVIEYNLS